MARRLSKRLVSIQQIEDTSRTLPIIGLDTALYMYQKFRDENDYEKADELRKRIEISEWWPNPLHVSVGKDYRIYEIFNWETGFYK